MEVPVNEMNAKVAEDPSHPGVVAVRVGCAAELPIDFLVHNCNATPDPMTDVEEVEFPSWPPTRSGRGGPMRMGRF
jgi:hypothetical protein